MGIGLLMWGYSFLTKHEEVQVPTEDPISKVQLTPRKKPWANMFSCSSAVCGTGIVGRADCTLYR